MLTKNAIFWLCLFALIGVFIFSITDVLLPFITGVVLAYFFDPVCDWLQRKKISRSISSILIVILFIVILVITILFIAPLIFDQLYALLQKIPSYVDSFKNDYLPQIKQKLDNIDPKLYQNLTDESDSIIKDYAGTLTSKLSGVIDSGGALLNFLSLMFITPIVAFYILNDWDVIKTKIRGLYPKKSAKTIKRVLKDIDGVLSGFIRGQTNVCLVAGIYYSIALSIFGLNYGAAIGALTGLLTFIPYVGMFLGMGTGLAVAFFQYASLVDVGIVAVIFMVGSIAEGQFLTPKLVGDKVGLHPALIIFGMLAGASLLGFWGVLLAVPISAVIGVLIRFAIKQYQKSNYYLQK